MAEGQKTFKRRKLIILIGVVFLLIGIAGIGWWWYKSTTIISTDDARINGTIVSVSPKISGRVAEVMVKEGDVVRKGEILARIDKRDTDVQENQAKAALAVAKAKRDALVAGARPEEIGEARAVANQTKASADQALANLKNAEKNYQRMITLYNNGAISATQKDNVEADYLMAKKGWQAAVETTNSAEQKLKLVESGSREEDIRAAEAQVKQDEAKFDMAKLNGEYVDIISPVDGVIALKSTNCGEVVAIGQTLFSVVDSSDLWLSARIEETKIGKIMLGQTVEYTIDGYPDQIFSGKVYEIGIATNSTFALVPTENASGNFTKVTQRIPVKISLPQNKENIVFRPGMQALIDIHLQ